jgi:hypothetical protein
MSANMCSAPSQTLAQRLELQLHQSGIAGRLSPLNHLKLADDAPPKFVLRDPEDRPSGFVLCSSTLAPDLIGRGVQRARQAREALGPELGQAVLLPIHAGEMDGLSFAVLPYCQPISTNRIARWVQRRQLRGALFSWLLAASRKTVAAASPDELGSAWEAPLRAIERESFAAQITRDALDQLQQDKWRPQFVLAHNDLWIGNILRAPAGGGYRFVIIDWLGSTPRGLAVYDLVRLAESTGLPARALADELEKHRVILSCTSEQLKFYLLSAMGNLLLNLERFPIERFRAMASSCLATLQAALALAEEK